MQGEESLAGEINAKRINIVDDNGKIRLALFNGSNVPDAVVDGQDLKRSVDLSGMAGLAFYNEDGDECGGLIYGNKRAVLAFDQYKQDEILGLSYHERDGKRQYGLYLEERSNTPMKEMLSIVMPVMQMEDGSEKKEALEELRKQGFLGVPRLSIERKFEGEVSVELADSKGQPRLRMKVDTDDNPRIEFLNSCGEVVYKLPPDEISMD
ncbi:hypothetical protein [Alicyclobacillus fastidiosus]|uniref:DUF4340 domain-containing protein n=1 Tax=Alicyclobacillus fastidiosus TaxID=392011 RepID=A0ABV5AKA1_9BACL|nr:hypothetical protein [Alicyclobacillus fastidiosus]WEH08436.1 hypothetical protein PYS47_17310 [Alicyclobacillus fastidiosus]